MKPVRNIKKLIQRIRNDIYFLNGIPDIIIFLWGSIFYLGLVACAIGLFVLPVSYLVSLLLIWIGIGTLGYKIVSVGFVIVVIGAYLFVILYYAEMNVYRYREQLPYTFQQADEILESLSFSERGIWEAQINKTLSKLIQDFQKKSKGHV